MINITSCRNRIAKLRADLAHAESEVAEALAFVCPECGRKAAERLSIVETAEVAAYAKSNCTRCLLTDVPRK